LIIMCGRVRLSSDYSEIKINLKFDPASPGAKLYQPPTEPMLVCVLRVHAMRLAKRAATILLTRDEAPHRRQHCQAARAIAAEGLKPHGRRGRNQSNPMRCISAKP
jgi:hypothetical protein